VVFGRNELTGAPLIDGSNNVLGSPNPFVQWPAPKFAPEKTELRYHTASQIGNFCTNCVKIAAATLAT
jgi:hypothetical protein